MPIHLSLGKGSSSQVHFADITCRDREIHGVDVYVQDWWDQWFRNRLQHIGRTNTNWATSQIADMRRLWAVRTGSNVTPTIEALDKLNADASDMKIDTDDLD
ncbi:hypothetical protein N7489_000317 [Penicillium chrysogenum]|uniref:uncharacterized protein n=1 Tax=Penicillium chrysogenum TaxID=5076 RepID=UPI0024DF2F85|nr:uncharacterized protein N7489_000317 [Penicillium chrysogenum]KAJ5249907.1 hypothetical protein N7489_000317 [Penicillium chrysogenum]KAJ6148476.1 hypothetical protein N7497_010458 [Penicillium chrysogenum]